VGSVTAVSHSMSFKTGALCLVCNVSQSWQVAHVRSHCEYSLEVADGINADVSLYIGLKSINITLRGPHSSKPQTDRPTVQSL